VDRRAAFFLLASIAGFVLAPIADPEHRWVAFAVGVVYAVLAVASFLDFRSRAKAPSHYGKRER
jgi:hypothetical protein